MTYMTRCEFIPPYLLQRLAESHPDADVCLWGSATLVHDDEIRSRRTSLATRGEQAAAPPPSGASAATPFTIYTANHTTTLPGTAVRAEGAPDSGDSSVDEAYTSVSATIAMYAEVFARASFDGRGSDVLTTVHYDNNYDNAFWDGTQLIAGDGDGKVFGSFTKPIDVLAHEFTHGVTQFTAAFDYQGQSGALNESVSDCFGSMVKQRTLGQSAQDADWLIGQGIFVPGVQGVALRSMKAPGTAYDDPSLGKDPQVANMADFVETTDDNGGVHTNSGIPNHAFYLASVAIGGNTWEGAGPIWYAALTGSNVSKSSDFAAFGTATVDAAVALHGDGSTQSGAVRDAWTQVGVTLP
ncbi:MAG: M4 family metallopeptidase [Nocardioidaceae bacterium]